MPPIRNSCVARGVLATGAAVVVFTVPDSTVLLLKNIQLYFTTGTGPTVAIYLAAPSGTPAVLVANTGGDAHGIASWSGWTAMNAGDYIYMVDTGGTLQYWIAGALLPFVPGF